MPTVNDTLGFGAQNLQAAYLRAQVIEALFTLDTVDRFQAALNNLGITIPLLVYQGPFGPNNVPRYALLGQQGFFFIFIGGIETTEQGRAVWDGFTGPRAFGALQNLGVSLPMQSWANEMWLNLMVPLQNASGVYVCGHSAGGYVANVLGAIIAKSLTVASRVTVVTFGTPKLGIEEALPYGMQRYHWWNTDDAVPTIPPMPSLSGPWILALTPPQIVSITYFDQYNNGASLAPDGTVTEGSGPPDLGQPDWISAGAWLVNNCNGVPNPHNVQFYTLRLFLAVQAQPNFNPPPPPANVLMRQDIVNLQEARRARDVAVQTVFTTDRPGAIIEATVPDAQAFSVQRCGRAYVVLFGDTIICIGPHRRTAHGLSRMGNAFLRRLQTEGKVDPLALTSQLALYLEAAATDLSFRPLMNVVTDQGDIP